MEVLSTKVRWIDFDGPTTLRGTYYIRDEALEGTPLRNSTAALIQYASSNGESSTDKIARFAVMHLRLASAPLEVLKRSGD